MIRLIWAVAVVAALSACASLGDFANVLTGTSVQKITKTPIWVYKPDLIMSVGPQEKKVFGVGVTELPLDGEVEIKVWSPVNADQVQVSTCARFDICQHNGICDRDTFTVPENWFGNPGKYLTFKFRANIMERQHPCSNIMIAVFSKKVLAAWGYVVLRGNLENTFPSRMSCNARDAQFDGTSVCSVKAGTIQKIMFDQPLTDFRAENSCGMKKIADGDFNIKPEIGWCRASFASGQRKHHLIINGFDEVLIRDAR